MTKNFIKVQENDSFLHDSEFIVSYTKNSDEK